VSEVAVCRLNAVRRTGSSSCHTGVTLYIFKHQNVRRMPICYAPCLFRAQNAQNSSLAVGGAYNSPVLKRFLRVFFYFCHVFNVFLFCRRFLFCFYFLSNTCRPARQTIVTVICVLACNCSPKITYDNCKIPLSTSSLSYLELRFRY